MTTGPGPLRVSVCIPTLNAAAALEECLESIAFQDYPHDLVEIIVADGGSTDATRQVAERYAARVVDNPLKTGEAGKAAAATDATGDVCAFIDSDNILPTGDWLSQMMAPFAHEHIVATEPIRYTRRSADPATTRYFAMLGMNDPVCLFIGNYDRMCDVTGTWTGLPVPTADRGGWLECQLGKGALPTIGANGFIIRRADLLSTPYAPYLFDIDVMVDLIGRGRNRVAKVKCGIVHLYTSDLEGFARKQRRRVRDFHTHKALGDRSYDWSTGRGGVLRFAVLTALTVPTIWQALKGFRRRRDLAWALHPAACWITLWVYGVETLRARTGRGREEDRSDWKQVG